MPSRRLIKDPERYKTVLCATWTSTGECPYGRKCQFAHGKEELRARAAMAVPQQRLPGMPGMPLNVSLGLPQPPMSMWPSGPSSLLPSHLGMPPLPAGPPPMQHAPMGQPPLPPGPPPTMQLPGSTSYDAANRFGSFAPQQQQQRSDGLHAFACAPSAAPPQMMPGALLNTCNACAPAAAPVTTPPLPCALLPSACLPAMAPLPMPAAAAPTAERPFAYAMPPAAAPTAEQPFANYAHAMPPAAAPSAERPFANYAMPAAAAPTAERPFASACAPAPAPAANTHVPMGAVPPRLNLPRDLGDELACFAMQCHLAEHDTSAGDVNAATGAVGDGRPPRIWSQAAPLGELAINPVSGRVEALDAPLDSPLEPGLPGSKKDVSFSTLLVRRAVSFIFDDPSGVGEPRLPSALASPRHATHSPHRAMSSPGAAIAA